MKPEALSIHYRHHCYRALFATGKIGVGLEPDVGGKTDQDHVLH